MAIIINKTLTTPIACPAQLQVVINADINIITNCLSVTIDNGLTLFLEFAIAITTSENIALDALLSTFTCNTSPTLASIDRGYLDTMWQAAFSNEKSGIKNMWLSHRGDNSMSSNKTPVIVPFKSKLVGITMSNKHNNVNTAIKIYSTPEGGGISPKTVDFTWTLSNVRTARKTDFSPDILYDAGDKIGVYVTDLGNDPAFMVVDMYFVIIEETFANGIDNYLGEFRVGLGGGSK